MNTSSIGELERNSVKAGFRLPQYFLPEIITTANIVGLLGGLCTLLLFFGLPMPWNIRIPFYLVLLIWTILRPRVALYLMPLAVPWGSLDTLTIAGLNLNSADILVAMFALGWLMSYALRPLLTYDRNGIARYDRGPLDRASIFAPLYLIVAIVALIGAMILSMRGAISINSSLKEISKWLEFLVLILVGTQYLRKREHIWILLVMIILGGITQAFYGYIQAFFNLGPEAFIRDTSLRVYGTFGQPNPYAGYLNIPLSIAVALLLLGSNWRTRILAGLATLVIGGAFYLTQSRGAQIAISVAIALILIVGMPRLRKPIFVLVILLLLLLETFFAGILPTYILTPAFQKLGLEQISFLTPNAVDYSTAERLAHWIAGIRMFLAHPLTGVGIGNYPDAYSHYYISIFVNSLGHSHNYYINIAAETGAIGLTAFLLFLMAIFVAGGSAYRMISAKWESLALLVKPDITVGTPLGLSQERGEASGSCVTPYPKYPPVEAPLEWQNKLRLLLQPVRMLEYYQPQGTLGMFKRITNDRALAIGLIAALLTVCTHNLVDDLFVHSLTHLIALLLIALLSLASINAKSPVMEKK